MGASFGATIWKIEDCFAVGKVGSLCGVIENPKGMRRKFRASFWCVKVCNGKGIKTIKRWRERERG